MEQPILQQLEHTCPNCLAGIGIPERLAEVVPWYSEPVFGEGFVVACPYCCWPLLLHDEGEPELISELMAATLDPAHVRFIEGGQLGARTMFVLSGKHFTYDNN